RSGYGTCVPRRQSPEDGSQEGGDYARRGRDANPPGRASRRAQKRVVALEHPFGVSQELLGPRRESPPIVRIPLGQRESDSLFDRGDLLAHRRLALTREASHLCLCVSTPVEDEDFADALEKPDGDVGQVFRTGCRRLGWHGPLPRSLCESVAVVVTVRLWRPCFSTSRVGFRFEIYHLVQDNQGQLE